MRTLPTVKLFLFHDTLSRRGHLAGSGTWSVTFKVRFSPDSPKRQP